MRGALATAHIQSVPIRIIPADAGSTQQRMIFLDDLGDHPRGCGEHGSGPRQNGRHRGSSPRMRGAPRISSIEKIHPEDHPRGCGEHANAGTSRIFLSGSSPRMRGAQHLIFTRHTSLRIIPADAGSTCSWASWGPQRFNHPRGCGEHLPPVRGVGTVPGSSPRMRGAQIARMLAKHLGGIIPADAGSTPSSTPSSPCSTDHPRGCGEHDCPRTLTPLTGGSSPRMRGAQGSQGKRH